MTNDVPVFDDQSEQHRLAVTVAGAGLTGLLTSLAMAQIGQHVTLHGDLSNQRAIPANRPMALSYASLRILSQLLDRPVDSLVKALNATEIKTIHVSEQGHINHVKLSAAQQNHPWHGVVIHSDKLWTLCQKACNDHTGIHSLSVKSCETESTELSQALLIIAEGQRSALREKLGYETVYQPYAERAITGLLQLDQPHKHTAYERFTPAGPLALLPFGDDQMAFVLTLKAACSVESNIGSDQVRDMIQTRIGKRLGNINSIDIQGNFPLSLQYATKLSTDSSVVLGNAALNLHPIAGQGFNLVIKDIAWLQELLSEVSSLPQALATYNQQRIKDHWLTRNFTQSLVEGASISALSPARGIGLGLINTLPPLQHAFAQLGGGRWSALPKSSFDPL